MAACREGAWRTKVVTVFRKTASGGGARVQETRGTPDMAGSSDFGSFGRYHEVPLPRCPLPRMTLTSSSSSYAAKCRARIRSGLPIRRCPGRWCARSILPNAIDADQGGDRDCDKLFQRALAGRKLQLWTRQAKRFGPSCGTGSVLRVTSAPIAGASHALFPSSRIAWRMPCWPAGAGPLFKAVAMADWQAPFVLCNDG